MTIASMEGNPAIAKMLIQHGADANKKDKEGKTVLMVNVSSIVGIISLLLLSIQLAALNGHEELVKLLLENGANPFVKNQVASSLLKRNVVIFYGCPNYSSSMGRVQ